MDATSSTSPATASRGNSARKALFALLRLAIGVAILVYMVKSGRVDLHSLTRVFRAWPLTLLGMAMLLIDMLFMSIRVSRLFHAQRLSLGLWNAIQLTLIGFFFSTFLPGAAGGDLAKLYYVTRENEGRRAEVATVLLFDRIIGLLSLVLIPFFFVPFFLELLRNASTLRGILWLDAILGLGMCAAMALVMFSGKFRMALLKLLGRWQGLQNNNRAHVRCDGRIRQSTRHLTRRDGPLVPCKSGARRRDGPPLTAPNSRGSFASWRRLGAWSAACP